MPPSRTRSFAGPLVRHLPWLAIAALYGVAYARFVMRKGVAWSDWADQARYVRSAQAFAALRFDPADHWYPLLYPLLGAPFVRVWPETPFLLVDLLCVVGAFVGFAAVARRFGIGPWVAVLLFAASTILIPRMGHHWLAPWTTTPSAALIWLGLSLTLAILQAPAPRWKAISLALCLAAIPMVRPGDIGVVTILGALAGWVLFAHRDFGSIGRIAFTIGLCWAVYLMLHCAIYGPQLSDYDRVSMILGENFAWLGWKAYLLLVDPGAWFPDGEGLLRVYPWLILGASGLLFAATRSSEHRLAAFCVLLVVFVYGATMLAYVDLLPSGLWRYGNAHYFKWMMPAFALFAILFLRDIRHAPMLGAAILMALFLATCIRIVPVPIGADVPARMLAFAQPKADFRMLYFAHSAITDAQGISRNIVEYHQIPADQGPFFAVALKRDFAGREKWEAQARGVSWPGVAPGSSHSDVSEMDDAVEVPLARFAPVLKFGVPCWTRLAPCEKSISLSNTGVHSY